MKQKLKTNKGITLIALIITIIVLLILAAVAIAAIKGDGIISHAKNAKKQYSGAQTNEQDMLSNYELMLAKETGNVWKQEKTKVTKGDMTLEVGDEIKNFTAGEKAWKILGVENGQLLLTTENIVAKKNFNDTILRLWDEATSSYKNAENELNKICVENIKLDNLTDEIKSKVTEVRSINAEDINRVTGYSPAATGDGNVYGAKNIYQYGNEVTYSVVKNERGTVTEVKYESAVKSGTSADWKQFLAPNTSTDITGPYTVKSTSYSYYPYSLTTSNSTTGECKGVATNSPAYELLFANTDYGSGSYWLASSFVNAREDVAAFGLICVFENHVLARPLWESSGAYYYDIDMCGVRPVVSLKSDVQLEKNVQGTWDIK